MVDDKLAFYDKEWRKEHDKRLEGEKRLGELAQELAAERQRYEDLRRHLTTLQTERDSLRLQAQQFARDKEVLAGHLDILEQQLQALKASLAEPGAWLEAVLPGLAEDLELLDALPEVAQQSRAADPTDWVIETAQSLNNLEQQFDLREAERLRRLLGAQWVYLRWLELGAPGQNP